MTLYASARTCSKLKSAFACFKNSREGDVLFFFKFFSANWSSSVTQPAASADSDFMGSRRFLCTLSVAAATLLIFAHFGTLLEDELSFRLCPPRSVSLNFLPPKSDVPFCCCALRTISDDFVDAQSPNPFFAGCSKSCQDPVEGRLSGLNSW